jgi:hypothetical protein
MRCYQGVRGWKTVLIALKPLAAITHYLCTTLSPTSNNNLRFECVNVFLNDWHDEHVKLMLVCVRTCMVSMSKNMMEFVN